MASYTHRKNKDGSHSIRAIVRKGLAPGAKALTGTFVGDTEREARDEAEDWARRTERQIRMKKYKDPRSANIRLEDAFKRYFKNLDLQLTFQQEARRKKSNTIQREKFARNAIFNSDTLGKDSLLSEIDGPLMGEYRDERLSPKEVRKKVKGKMQTVIEPGKSGSTVRKELYLISNLFNAAAKSWGYPVENPVRQMDWIPAQAKPRKSFLEVDQINKLLAECSRSRNKLLLPWTLIMLQTGLRPSEAAGLKGRNIDVKGRAVVLFEYETKTDEERRIPLTDTAFREIAKLMIGKKADDYLFFPDNKITEYQKKGPVRRFRDAYDNARKRAGLEWVTRHDLRRTAGSHMIMRGVDIRTIAAILGHSTLQQSMTYTRLNDDATRGAVNTIGDLGKHLAVG